MDIAVAVAALVVSIATMIFAAVQFKYVAKSAYVEQLEHRCAELETRVQRLEKEVEDCEKDRAKMLKHNYDLLNELATLKAKL